MNYRIISVARLREPFYIEGCQEYLKRIKKYARVEIVEGLEEKINPRAGEMEIEKALTREGHKIQALLDKDDFIVLLEPRGEKPDSERFAALLNDWNQSRYKRVNLLIGSAHGLSMQIKSRADFTLSLSSFTLPHQLAVLVLCEQIYRGFKIIKGEPYHK